MKVDIPDQGCIQRAHGSDLEFRTQHAQIEADSENRL